MNNEAKNGGYYDIKTIIKTILFTVVIIGILFYFTWSFYQGVHDIKTSPYTDKYIDFNKSYLWNSKGVIENGLVYRCIDVDYYLIDKLPMANHPATYIICSENTKNYKDNIIQSLYNRFPYTNWLEKSTSPQFVAGHGSNI